MKVISYKNTHYITIPGLPYIKYIIYYLNQVLSNHKLSSLKYRTRDALTRYRNME